MAFGGNYDRLLLYANSVVTGYCFFSSSAELDKFARGNCIGCSVVVLLSTADLVAYRRKTTGQMLNAANMASAHWAAGQK